MYPPETMWTIIILAAIGLLSIAAMFLIEGKRKP